LILFQPTEAPDNLALEIPRIRCLSWSPPMREWLWRWAEKARQLPPPSLQYFQKKEYSYTLALDPSLLSGELRDGLGAAARAFHRLSPARGVTFFDRILDDRINGHALATFLGALRNRMVEMTGDELTAIYAPLGATGEAEQGEFPLHSDLYPPVFLFNIFDRVGKDSSGASLFLPMRAARQAVEDSALIPAGVKLRFYRHLDKPSNSDGYEDFYDILHGEHRWTAEIEQAMASQQIRVRMLPGQGYLVHDRLWLHGREAPRGEVRENRLHRLIFDTQKSRQERIGGIGGRRKSKR
jgi:hypothetical protein